MEELQAHERVMNILVKADFQQTAKTRRQTAFRATTCQGYSGGQGIVENCT